MTSKTCNRFTILMLVIGFFSSALPAQEKSSELPAVAVFPVLNATGKRSYDPLGTAVTYTVGFTLKLMERYNVVDVEHSVSAGDLDEIKRYAQENEIDNVIFGEIRTDEKERIVIRLAVYDRFEGGVTISEEAPADTILDTFEVSDALVVSLVEGFSGVHVGYGTLQLENQGEEGGFTVYIDRLPVGQDLTTIEKVFVGEHRVRVEQERIFGPHVVYDGSVAVQEGTTSRVYFSIPDLLQDEQLELGRIDRLIRTKWNDPEAKDEVMSALEQIVLLMEKTAASSSFSELREKYTRWREDFKEYWGRRSTPPEQKASSLLIFEGFKRLEEDRIWRPSETFVNTLAYQVLLKRFSTTGAVSRISAAPGIRDISTMHRASINVDGKLDDWQGIPPVKEDPQNDVRNYGKVEGHNTGADLEKLWCAIDDAKFYVAIKTYDGQYPRDLRYKSQIYISNRYGGDPSYDLRIEFGRSAGGADFRTMETKNGRRRSGQIDYSIGEVIEYSMPISFLRKSIAIRPRIESNIKGVDNGWKDALVNWVYIPWIRYAIEQNYNDR